MTAHLSHLLIKPVHKQPLVDVDKMDVAPDTGIAGHIVCSPLRQVLLLEAGTLAEFSLEPGDLRENIIVDGLALYDLPSGTVLQCGDVTMALTFLCEPCNVIAGKVNLKAIRHKRGYLGRFLNTGTLRVGDAVQVTDQQVETIPEIPVERIAWYLNKIDTPIMASELMWQCGLAASYCRALPAMLRKHPEIEAEKIIFKNNVLSR